MTQQRRSRDNSRTVMLRLRVTVAEKALLQSRAGEAGLTISDWVRGRAIGSKPVALKASPEKETLLRILAGLGKSGSNLNQVARQLNRKQERLEFEIPLKEIMWLLEEFREISEALREAINGSNKR